MRCIVTGKVPTIYLKVFVLSVLLERTTMFVYKLPIRLLLKYWRISDVFHASLISDFFGWDRCTFKPPAAVQPSRHSAVLQVSFQFAFSSSVVVTLSSFTCREQCNCSATHVVPKITRRYGYCEFGWKSPHVMVRVSFLFPCWCLDIVKIDKIPLIYSFQISIWGAWCIVWGGWAHQIPPVATGLAVCETWKSIAVPRSIWLPNNCRKVFAHFGQGWLM